MNIMNFAIVKLSFAKLPRVSFLMKFHAKDLQLYLKEIYEHNFQKAISWNTCKYFLLKPGVGKYKLILLTGKMSIDEKKLRYFI